ncbi:hypothetical protein MAF45_07795 [Mesosutterella sp. OilRF-GAM-744-9]|uniref:Uncharacterized protein n=1 Tax=Mesosutterella porci TaxID=2915351 RepID=A0ABS9MRU8_9BURK|nr:hypothetical protein [Mesosutterella sp. oilRF-744-WT-GAM-9]MCG5031341.1 hypothetical protein [Mesosutterella sp. oilRF-744-WT-GAM-9]
MTEPYSSARVIPTLSRPIVASWSELEACSSRAGALPEMEPAEPSREPSLEPAPAPEPDPAPRSAQPSASFFRVPSFSGSGAAERIEPAPLSPPAAQPAAHPAAPAEREPVRFSGLSRRETPRPVRSLSTEELIAYLQPRIQRSILEQLDPVIEQAARSAAASAADRIRNDVSGRLDLIVKNAVSEEIARYFRN